MKEKKVTLSDAEVRSIVLRFFYDRGKQATSARGKAGFAVRMSDVKKSLKASHQLSQQQVVSNLHYLISQGWIEEDQVLKSVPLPSGTVIPESRLTSKSPLAAQTRSRARASSPWTI